MTKIIIAQRISSVEHCDRILVMDNGMVTGFDTHDALLKSNALYREIYDIQMSERGDFDVQNRCGSNGHQAESDDRQVTNYQEAEGGEV